VITRLIGALLRALMIVIVIMTPSLLTPGTSAQGAQMVTLVALACAMIVAFEYGAKFPGLIEFRDAPPFNRIRIIALFLTLFGLSVISSADQSGSTLTVVITPLGFLVGHALDFPYSPLQVVVDALPADVAPTVAAQIQAMAGLAMLITLLALFLFSALIRLEHWPHRDAPFNVWVNLPTFDPTAGGDVVRRLVRDGRVNIIFGVFAPFVIPIVAVMGASQLQVPVWEAPQTMILVVAVWMFLPLSMVMRGQAMLRIARMIRARRARLVAGVGADAPGGVGQTSPV
jgi:hypothetical protein